MTCDAAELSRFAPGEWLDGLVPTDFKSWDWLFSDVQDRRLDIILRSLGTPMSWKWKVSDPMNGEVSFELSTPNSNFNKIELEGFVQDTCGLELAYAKANVRMTYKTFKLAWIGRRGGGSKPVHRCIRGRRCYETAG